MFSYPLYSVLDEELTLPLQMGGITRDENNRILGVRTFLLHYVLSARDAGASHVD